MNEKTKINRWVSEFNLETKSETSRAIRRMSEQIKELRTEVNELREEIESLKISIGADNG